MAILGQIKTKRTQWRFPADVRWAIDDLLAEGVKSPREIHERLEQAIARGELAAKVSDVPSQKTIQRYVGEHAPLDPSEPWSPLQSDASSVRLILPVLAEVISATRGRRRQLTVDEARTIAQVRRMAPGLELWRCYLAARAYLARLRVGESVEDLDAYFAFGGWGPGRGLRSYQHAVAEGWVAPTPLINARAYSAAPDDLLAALESDSSSDAMLRAALQEAAQFPASSKLVPDEDILSFDEVLGDDWEPPSGAEFARWLADWLRFEEPPTPEVARAFARALVPFARVAADEGAPGERDFYKRINAEYQKWKRDWDEQKPSRGRRRSRAR